MKEGAFDLPSELVDRHLDADPSFAEDKGSGPDPEHSDLPAAEEPPSGAETDTPPDGEDPDFDDLEDKGDEDELEDGDEEGDDYDLEDEAEEDPDPELDDEGDDLDSADDPILGKLTNEQLEAIKGDPRLRTAHKLMHGRFTEVMQELRELEEGLHARESDVQAFMQEVRTPDGAVALVKTFAVENPEVVGKAFEAAYPDAEAAAKFLVEVGLAHPDALDKALDKVQRLESDPDALERHKETNRLARERAEIEAEKAETQKHQAKQRAQEVRSWMEGYADKAEIPDEERQVLERRVIEKIRANRTASGRSTVTKAEVRDIVKGLRDEVRQREERIRKRLEKEGRKKRASSVRRKATRRSRPPAPRSGGSPAPRKGSLKVPQGKDRLEHALDTAFDRLTQD